MRSIAPRLGGSWVRHLWSGSERRRINMDQYGSMFIITATWLLCKPDRSHQVQMADDGCLMPQRRQLQVFCVDPQWSESEAVVCLIRNALLKRLKHAKTIKTYQNYSGISFDLLGQLVFSKAFSRNLGSQCKCYVDFRWSAKYACIIMYLYCHFRIAAHV